jgi:hypothetical protein
MTFKPLSENDITFTRTLLHEAIPLTGSIISGTYADSNIKDYSHGMFQSVFDYPYLSSSANHIFDLTVGVSKQSALYSSVSNMQSKKKNIYNQMAQVLMGYDANGNILQFDQDGDIIGGGVKMNEVFIMPFTRLLSKDEIKKETFQLQLAVQAGFTGSATVFNDLITISDVSASTEYRVNSPAGEYGILYATASTNDLYLDTSVTNHTTTIGGFTYWYAGLIFYQAGICVLTSSLFASTADSGYLRYNVAGSGVGDSAVTFGKERPQQTVTMNLTGSSISASANDVRARIYNVQFNNTTELNSTVYFCRANHNEFNYSSNPTYVDKSKIQVKTVATDNPVAYITTVGLYNDNNELLATAKLSEPLKKDPSTEFTIRARLDY